MRLYVVLSAVQSIYTLDSGQVRAAKVISRTDPRTNRGQALKTQDLFVREVRTTRTKPRKILSALIRKRTGRGQTADRPKPRFSRLLGPLSP